MKEKIKKYFKEFIEYTLTNEFKTMVMLLLFFFATIGVFWAIISTALVNESIDVLEQQQEKYEELEKKYETLQFEYNNQKMWNDELYELFTTCQNNKTWYEEFYYNNVEPYTGEIEGEYYE